MRATQDVQVALSKFPDDKSEPTYIVYINYYNETQGLHRCGIKKGEAPSPRVHGDSLSCGSR